MYKTLLETLKKYGLASYYVDLYRLGIQPKEIMAQISINEFPQVKFKAPEDEMKFKAMFYDLQHSAAAEDSETNTETNFNSEPKENTGSGERSYQPKSPKEPSSTSEPIRSNNSNSNNSNNSNSSNNSNNNNNNNNNKTEVITPISTLSKVADQRPFNDFAVPVSKQDSASKKRAFPATKHSPERNVRRMTSSVNVQRTSPLPRIPAQRTPPSKAVPRRISTVPAQRINKPNITPPMTPTISINNDLNQRIRVCVRKRPLNKKEKDMQQSDIVNLVGERTIQLNAPKTKIDLTPYIEKHAFTFDDAFDSNSSNADIYARTAQPLVDYIFSGGKATCFAYGQTGSGKTYTMLDSRHGLYVLAAQDIFRMLSKPAYSHLQATVGLYEIYQGQLFDLLNKREKLTARDDGHNNIVIAGLRECYINDVEDLMDTFESGNRVRTTGTTGANNASSRSHAVLQILLKSSDDDIFGKLSFIDLAGSERGADRGEADTKTRMEGAEINKSLLALKECIRALDQDKKHTPFRGSKLTQVLRDSFTGNSRTCMIATISPNNTNSEHTLNTLRYADRVKQLKGESDPRIQQGGHQLTNLVDGDTDASSYGSWGDDENLLDEDFPVEAAANALATPTNNRFESILEHQQVNYLKRLESPPAEVFSKDIKMEDPFFSSPVRLNLPSDNDVDTEMSSLEIANKTKVRNVQHIRNILKAHRNSMKQYDEHIREEEQILARLSLAISEHEEDEESDQINEAFETYLNDLDEILFHKTAIIDHMKSII
ncbi:P-loop containing nucleoside triphosphate hydrolase protein [Mucor mucedo]|uniref:P-loop containing nucleoside triphosphate hydrolase protein n=1 Tax=Mucor mucedo TaxID=29922 RepID=UPI00221F5DB9|nr:P-loop containing nucleoside triphosphate hydrolase protein [Mucor mucedo]KAI7892513.1 P-loop containing nucleoside triphosphate hydrolase protein [Mucor mucedo]